MKTQSNKTLIVIDIQKEYNSLGRPFYLEGVTPSLENAKNCLEYARKNNFNIIHVKHIQDGEIFSTKNEFSDFINHFEPSLGEHVVIKSNYSSYSSLDFCALLKDSSDVNYVIGYGSTMCCLSTILEGYHKGNKFIFIADASLAKKTALASESVMHLYATEIIKNYAEVTSSADFLLN